MKQFSTMLAVALLFTAGLANAQLKQGEQLIGADVGIGVPLSSNADSTKVGAVGPLGGVSYDYMILKNVSVGGDINVKGFGKSSDSTDTYNLSATVFTVLATAKFSPLPDNNIRPYGLVGIGYGHAGATATSVADGSTLAQSGAGSIAWALGIGGDYDINSQFCAGAEVRFTGLSVDQSLGAQSYNSLDFMLTGRFKIGG